MEMFESRAMKVINYIADKFFMVLAVICAIVTLPKRNDTRSKIEKDTEVAMKQYSVKSMVR